MAKVSAFPAIPAPFLFLAFNAPPLPYSRAAQLEKLLRSLGLRCRLITSQTNQGQEAELAAQARLPSVEFRRFPFPDRAVASRLALWLFPRIAYPLLDEPDQFIRWSKVVTKHVRSHPRDFDLAAVVSFSEPLSTHLAGLWLSRALGVPWVAYFSDPWTQNPFVEKNWIRRVLNRRMEEQVFRHASAVVFTSQETKELFLDGRPRYSAEKVHVLEHGYETRGDTPPPPGKPFVLRSLGQFYRIRSPEPLLRAMHHLLRDRPELRELFTIELIGRCDHYDLRAAEGEFPPGLLRYFPEIPYHESLPLIRSAHLLLLIDAPLDKSPFFPAKLGEYLGTGRRIFGITPPGTAARVIASAGGYVCDPRDPKQIAVMLGRAIDDLVAGNVALSAEQKAYRETYAYSKLGARFRALLDTIAPGAVTSATIPASTRITASLPPSSPAD